LMVGVARHITTLSLRNTHYSSYMNSFVQVNPLTQTNEKAVIKTAF